MKRLKMICIMISVVLVSFTVIYSLQHYWFAHSFIALCLYVAAIILAIIALIVSSDTKKYKIIKFRFIVWLILLLLTLVAVIFYPEIKTSGTGLLGNSYFLLGLGAVLMLLITGLIDGIKYLMTRNRKVK
jgi:cytochrome bd-type quinol oxidase subunit 2